MGRWLETRVTVSIPAPVAQVWAVWADLETVPIWMRWIESVRLLNDELSEWTLVAQGLRFNWRARITCRIEGQQLDWESVDGLPNKGSVRFYPQPDDHTNAKFSISYEVPTVFASLMDSGLLEWLVRKELQANLGRFLDLVIQQSP